MLEFCPKFWQFFAKKCDFREVQNSALCRSRRELSNAYLLAKFRFDTAENKPCEVCRIRYRHVLVREAAPRAGPRWIQPCGKLCCDHQRSQLRKKRGSSGATRATNPGLANRQNVTLLRLEAPASDRNDSNSTLADAKSGKISPFF